MDVTKVNTTFLLDLSKYCMSFVVLLQPLSAALVLTILIVSLHLLTASARCIPGVGCNQVLQEINYYEHMNISETLTLNNVSVNLREAEGRTDQLGEFSTARVCPWHYEADYNSSRLPQVIYTARCDTKTWCDHTSGETYKCLPMNAYRVPIVVGRECDLFANTEWTLDFVDIAVLCYPSNTTMDSTEFCRHLS